MFQPLEILEWKWEEVTMDFVSGLLRSSEGYDSIWVIVDWMTKSTHFLSVKTMDPVKKLAKLYLKKIVQLHGVPVSIVSDQDVRFPSMFWKELQAGFGTRLKFSIALHPQTDGQSERTIQTLEDMLRVYTLDFPRLVTTIFGNVRLWRVMWEKVSITYPLVWSWGKKVLGPEEVDAVSKEIEAIKRRLQAFVDRKKKYTQNRWRPLEFEVGDQVFLKVSAMRGVMRFAKKGKLSPRYVGPFEIIESIGEVAY